MALVIGALALYMKVHGASYIKTALSELTGAQVDFKSIAINVDKQAASFKGFSVLSQVGFDKNIFDADIFTVTFNKEMLQSQKKLVFDSVYIKGANLNIIRNSRGKFNIAIPEIDTAWLSEPVYVFESLAYAVSQESNNPLYDILKTIKNIRVEKSIVTFEDYYRMSKPYKLWCDNLFIDISSSMTGSGYISTSLKTSFRFPQRQYGDGWFALKGGLAVYPKNTNMESNVQTSNIDLRLFQPYFSRNTPFYFNSGRFSSNTDFRMHGGQIDSLTTMYVDNLNLRINPHAPNAAFLNVSINRLAPYLRSGPGIVFDFVIKGSANRPKFGVGPKVKLAISMVVMEEVGKAIAQMQTQ